MFSFLRNFRIRISTRAAATASAVLLLQIIVLAAPNAYETPTEPMEDRGDRPAGEKSELNIALENGVRRIYDNLDLTYGIDWYRTGNYGDKSRSFKPDETFQMHNTTIGYDDKFGDVAMDIRSSLRWTDDITISRSKDFKIQSLYGNFEKQNKWALRFGDIFPNLSQYTYSRSARYGTHGWYKWSGLGGELKLAGALGVTNREQEFIGATQSPQYRRWASGGSLDWEGEGWKWLGKTTAGFRVSVARDDGATITSRRGPSNAKIPDLHIANYSFKYEAALPAGFGVQGENAYSNGNRDRSDESSKDRYGTAHRTAFNWRRPSAWGEPAKMARFLPISGRADYEWVSPNFLTDLGSAAVDQLKWGGGLDFRWNDSLDWSASYLLNHDNVRKRITSVTVPAPNVNINQTTSLKLNLKPFAMLLPTAAPEFLKELKYGFEFRFNDRDATNLSANSKIEDYNHSLDYRFMGLIWSSDYKFQLTDDDIAAMNDRRTDDWGLRLSRPTTFSIFEITIAPTAGYRHSVDKTIRGHTYTRTQTSNYGITAKWGEFDVNLGYTHVDVDRNQRAADSVNDQINGSLTFRPFDIEDLNFNASIRYQDVNEENGTSYRQMENKVHVDYKF